MTAYADLDEALKLTVDRIILGSRVPTLGLPPKHTDLPGYIITHFDGSIPVYVRHMLRGVTYQTRTDQYIVTITHASCFVELLKHRLTVKVDERTLAKLVKHYIAQAEAKIAEPEQLALFGDTTNHGTTP